MFDGDKTTQEHIETRLMGWSPLVAEIGDNTVTGNPQVYPGKPPQDGMLGTDPATGYPPPYVVYFNQSNGSIPISAQDEDPEAALIAYTAAWSVLVVGPAGDEDRVDRAKQEVLNALQGTEGNVPSLSGYVLVCDLNSSVWLPPQAIEGGPDYIRRGWTFRIIAQPVIP